ncbi:MAG: serine hydrolase [Paraburkholderia sp.]|nr:serine hydrolase [Paraburkholderia sp.]
MKDEIDDLVHAAMAEWKVPGLALAVIRDGEVVRMAGYGVGDIQTRSPVSNDTQFLLCSLTKSFTVAGLGVLVDDGRLDWGRPVRDYLPEFRLHNDVSTERVTVLDLLCHHTGVPRHDWIHAPGDLSTRQILAALRYLEPNLDLRSAYQYQNLGYLVAGHVAERVAGVSWESLIADRLLEPLGFRHFGFSVESLAATSDHACPHVLDDGEARRANWSAIRALPAGGLNASVSDLAKWMECIMGDGKRDGRSILSERVIKQIAMPRVHAGKATFDVIEDLHYGLGLQTGRYRGERVLMHTGSWLGWGTIMAMMPERKMGVAVLTNFEPSYAREVLVYSVLDRLCGYPRTDWFARFKAKHREDLVQSILDSDAYKRSRRLNAPPTHPMDSYAGDFEHAAYGRISIANDAGTLVWSWRGLSGCLEHRHYNVFKVPRQALALNPDGLPLTFCCNREGIIDRVVAPLEPRVPDIVFCRVGNEDLSNSEWLTGFVGTYMHGMDELTVSLNPSGCLNIGSEDTGTRLLMPIDEKTFRLDGLCGYSVEFQSDSRKRVSALMLHHPLGVMLASRTGQPRFSIT